MTERHEKSPVKRPGFLNGAKSMDRPPGRRGPAKVCEAKFCGEKEEQGSGRMAFFVKNKKRRSKANFAPTQWWARQGSNPRPIGYEPTALTS